ncbi:MAG: hypothetical protein KJI71_01685 [Patescibacteria group bacterium]|nr:hypothetical protein [Patescibacteria group bacterium]
MKGKEIINILGVGIGISLLIFLIIQVGFAQLLTDFVLINIDKQFTLFLIIFGLLFISFLSSIIASQLITKYISSISVLSASFMAFFGTLYALIIISYVTLFMYNPALFRRVHGFALFMIFPQVIITFTIYFLENIISLFIFSIVSYFLLFILFLNDFYIIEIKIQV